MSTTASGWRAQNLRPLSAGNFPIQAIGADVLRLASLRAEAAGIPIIFPNHDSNMIQTSAREIDDAVNEMARIMGDASKELMGIRLRVTTQIIRSEERYHKDPKSKAWWNAICQQLGEDP